MFALFSNSKKSMKKLVFTLLISVVAYASSAQSQEIAPGDSIPWELRKQSFIYSTANVFNDPLVARIALYNLLAENPGNVALYDSLALSYLQFNQNASAALAAQQAIRINPNDMFATEIAATALEQIGAKDRALGFYEKMYLSNQDINTLYKVSFLQYELQRYTEAETSLDIIINDETSKETQIVFPTTDRQGQEVPLTVAAYRIKAMMEEAKGNTEVAKAKYLEVLEMLPGFQVVQQQLRELTQQIEEE